MKIFKEPYSMEKNHHMVVMSKWMSLVVGTEIQVETIKG